MEFLQMTTKKTAEQQQDAEQHDVTETTAAQDQDQESTDVESISDSDAESSSDLPSADPAVEVKEKIEQDPKSGSDSDQNSSVRLKVRGKLVGVIDVAAGTSVRTALLQLGRPKEAVDGNSYTDASGRAVSLARKLTSDLDITAAAKVS
jgi:hypothetical protein